MRTVGAGHTTAWKAQAKTGDQRPVVRATIQKANLLQWDYDTFKSYGGDGDGKPRHRNGHFTSIIFGDPSMVREIRNIRNYNWSRSTEQDVATCTLTLLNSDITPIGNADEVAHADDFDLPGWFTYNRGQQASNPWGYDSETGWQDVYVPDRLVRTYEGYGSDPNVSPAEDPNLYQSGTWLIDKVTYTASGDITLQMRDVGRLLLDQIVFPPVVPYAEYPLEWEPIHTEQVPGRDCKGGSWDIPNGTASSSNDAYVGQGLTDPPYAYYVDSRGGVAGHYAKDALIKRDDTYWWSTGQTTASSKVWWQVDLDSPTALGAVRINPQGGPYRCYISVKTDRGWVGKKKIPYTVTTEGVDVEADIPFVKSVWVDRAFAEDHILPRKYRNVKAVRLTFSRLNDTKVSQNYPFRAGVDLVKLYTGNYDDLHFEKGTVLQSVGNFNDYTQIVKWVCAWGGFFWPDPSTGQDFQVTDQAGGQTTISYDAPDYILPKGRVWGTFMRTYTVTDQDSKLTVDLFDKKPLMDIINYVRDVVGFIFFIDEAGGVVWRLPNLGLNVNAPKQGNYLSPGHLEPRDRSRTASTVVISDEETIYDYSTTLSSANTRERIFVANVTGRIGTVIKGFRPTFQGRGFRRIAGWTDQHFKSKTQARIMADMVAAHQMFDYRRGKVTIPGYAAIQIDDQVQILERVTNETYFHYVLGITSVLDMESGKWEYTLDTHWLGEDPADAWVVKVSELSTATQNYLNALD